MKRFIEGADRAQVSLLPGCVEDYVEAENPVRVIEASRHLSSSSTCARWVSTALILRRRAGRRTTRGATQDLHLRLPEPVPVKPATRAGNPTQSLTLDWAEMLFVFALSYEQGASLSRALR
jgi:hypothetical protein